MTSTELRQAEAAIAALTVTIERARTRRNEIDAHGTQLAPRLTMRRSLATGGELVDWVFRRPRLAPRPITLLIDVSGSMELHARLMLRFAHVLRRIDRRTEVFVFGTRLTRVTRQLNTRDVDRALASVAMEVHDWSGGTRIGESLRTFNRRWVRRTGAADGIVIVLSDGWDRGDPALTAEETQRLRRNCRRLIWLNPLAGGAGLRATCGRHGRGHPQRRCPPARGDAERPRHARAAARRHALGPARANGEFDQVRPGPHHPLLTHGHELNR